jgi:hypothetical protein
MHAIILDVILTFFGDFISGVFKFNDLVWIFGESDSDEFDFGVSVAWCTAWFNSENSTG